MKAMRVTAYPITSAVDLDALVLDLEVLALEDLGALDSRLRFARERIPSLPPERRQRALEALRILEVELLAQRTNLQRRTRNVVR
jgi:hypothetical protein